MLSTAAVLHERQSRAHCQCLFDPSSLRSRDRLLRNSYINIDPKLCFVQWRSRIRVRYLRHSRHRLFSAVRFLQTFASFWQFIVALMTLPTALTLAEAFSPHTMDTPFIMGVGGAMIYAIITLL